MKDFVHSGFAKIILSIIGISLSLSLVTTVSCYGAIDNIFLGWRDNTTCLGGYSFNCLIGNGYRDTVTEDGVITSFILLFFIVCIYGKFFWRKNKFGKVNLKS